MDLPRSYATNGLTEVHWGCAMRTGQILAIGVAGILSCGCALAQEKPLGGAVYNLKLNEQISFSCRIVTETSIECDFTSAKVSPAIPPGKLDERMREALKGIDEPGAVEEFGKESCKALARLQDSSSTEDAESFNDLPASDREDILSAIKNVCEKHDTKSVTDFIALGLDKESKTCLISTWRWQAHFAKSDKRTWVRTDKDSPTADGCAGIYLDRFEMSENGSFWNLTRREIASNPNGTFTTGQKCSEVYTGIETEYRWQGSDLPAKCDYIRLNLN